MALPGTNELIQLLHKKCQLIIMFVCYKLEIFYKIVMLN